ncbi:hypothetical protein D3C81_680390 [compost metagenome]
MRTSTSSSATVPLTVPFVLHTAALFAALTLLLVSARQQMLLKPEASLQVAPTQ